MSTKDDEIERRVRDALRAGREQDAMAEAVRGYGPMIEGWLRKRLPSAYAQDAYQELLMEVWPTLPHFDWAIPLRVWMTTRAKYVLYRWIRKLGKDAALPSREAAGPEVPQPGRTDTLVYLLTAVKRQAFMVWHEQFSERSRQIMIWREGEKLSWDEIAVRLGEMPEPAGQATRVRTLNRLRKQYEVLKPRMAAFGKSIKEKML